MRLFKIMFADDSYKNFVTTFDRRCFSIFNKEKVDLLRQATRIACA